MQGKMIYLRAILCMISRVGLSETDDIERDMSLTFGVLPVGIGCVGCVEKIPPVSSLYRGKLHKGR